MLKKRTYLLGLLGILGVPSILLSVFSMQDVSLANMFLIVAVLGSAGVLADIWATRQNNKDNTWIWEFNSKNILRARILGHPVEEYIYFIVHIPYVVLFWELANRMVQYNDPTRVYWGIFIVLWVHFAALAFYRIQTAKRRAVYKTR